MIEAGEKVLNTIRKDWELIPNPSKGFIVFSGLASWYVSGEWKTPLYRNIFFVIILSLNLILLACFSLVKPWWLRRKYSLDKFLNKGWELLDDGGIWYVVDHRKKTIRWIANYATLVELGLRHLAQKAAPIKPPLPDELNGGKLNEYKAGRYIMIMGRRGTNIREE